MSEKEMIQNWIEMERQQPIQLATQDAYWQQVRIQVSTPILCELSGYMFSAGYSEKQVAEQALKLADALIAELKGGNNEND